jgi:hypothetical protein
MVLRAADALSKRRQPVPEREKSIAGTLVSGIPYASSSDLRTV